MSVAGNLNAGFTHRSWKHMPVTALLRPALDASDLFALDPARTHLSPGAYGAVPRPVLEAQQTWRARAEADPHRFHGVEQRTAVVAGRHAAADWLGVPRDALALVTNVTEAASTMLAALDLRAGDEIVLSNHGYGAIRRAVEVWCARAGVVLREALVSLDAEDETVVGAYAEQLSERTRLVVVDQITSPTARMMPVRAVVAAARGTDAMVLVDAAHGPGHVDVDVEDLGADAWVGNLHKWAFAARGTAALWIAPHWRARARPLVLGWTAADGFPDCFDARGTVDLSAWMTVPDALRLWGSLGGWQMVRRNAQLADWGQRLVADAIGVSLAGTPATPAPAMRLIPLPAGTAADEAAAAALYHDLSAESVEVGVISWGGRGWLRPGTQVFTTEDDHVRLAEVLRRLLGYRPANRSSASTIEYA
ncbi:MAG: aminotransferase class V-fold PLP-dependent enzyme [Nocardioidaceae bacterium]|nr:aminotransferase class V-fold PLP-dependent enzyme [Nocardioidaceae bacterium]MDQ3325755.1 aminotransferase class V-fold PLP-dependent enzyme [Actinomycetota bacterium]